MKTKSSEKVPASIKYGVLIFLLSLIGQPTLQGYIHPADPFVLLAAMRLPAKQGMLTCCIASVAADLIKGYYATAPFTLVIKLLMVLIVKGIMQKTATKRTPEIFVSIAALLPIPGYYIAQLIKWQIYSWISSYAYNPLYWANASLQKNIIQGVGSILIFLVVYDLLKGWHKIKQAAAEIKAEQDKEAKKEAQSE